MKIKRKSPLTIIEVMIVIFIISIVGGVMTHNMKGSLVKGRAFKTETASREAYDILSLELASGTPLDDILTNPSSILIHSGLVKNPKKLLQDGWGKDFQLVRLNDEDFVLYSKTWIDYLLVDKKMQPIEIEEAYPWAYNTTIIDEPKNPS